MGIMEKQMKTTGVTSPPFIGVHLYLHTVLSSSFPLRHSSCPIGRYALKQQALCVRKDCPEMILVQTSLLFSRLKESALKPIRGFQ